MMSVTNVPRVVYQSEIVNNLTSSNIAKPLSAAQGKSLKDSTTAALATKQDAPKTAGTAGQVLTLDNNLSPVWADTAPMLYTERTEVLLKAGATSAFDTIITLTPRAGFTALGVVGCFLYRNGFYVKRAEVGGTNNENLYISVYNSTSTSRTDETNESWFRVLYVRTGVIDDD